jgi:23S rRNA (pseudouridine1915-N3)-methyltransferase
MLKIKIIVVDRTRTSFLREGELLYLKRIRHYAPVDWIDVKPASIKKGRAPKALLADEEKGIARCLNNQDYLVAMDRSGTRVDSEGLAAWLEDWSISVTGHLTFLIGSPLGLSDRLLERADRRFSLSKLTLTHEMSRLVLLEQIFRAFTIMRGEPYHK